nr:MAG TPA: hypothetical protein [Caudoviricetes sp.]
MPLLRQKKELLQRKKKREQKKFLPKLTESTRPSRF